MCLAKIPLLSKGLTKIKVLNINIKREQVQSNKQTQYGNDEVICSFLLHWGVCCTLPINTLSANILSGVTAELSPGSRILTEERLTEMKTNLRTFQSGSGVEGQCPSEATVDVNQRSPAGVLLINRCRQRFRWRRS
ncbi:hypothetical protein J6590_029441 [Homalodisca vitripennis]|nr:hypothetical protein J6590_029441 [Homalodisca vitripennis]